MIDAPFRKWPIEVLVTAHCLGDEDDANDKASSRTRVRVSFNCLSGEWFTVVENNLLNAPKIPERTMTRSPMKRNKKGGGGGGRVKVRPLTSQQFRSLKKVTRHLHKADRTKQHMTYLLRLATLSGVDVFALFFVWGGCNGKPNGKPQLWGVL